MFGRRALAALAGAVVADGRTFAQIEIDRLRTPSGYRLRSSSYDLFQGDVSRSLTGNVVHVDFYNYLQDDGVRPGGNDIRLHVEQYGRARVARIVLKPG